MHGGGIVIVVSDHTSVSNVQHVVIKPPSHRLNTCSSNGILGSVLRYLPTILEIILTHTTVLRHRYLM